MSPICAVLAPSSPDFLGESRPALWRGFVNDTASGVMCAAIVLQNGLGILRQCFSAGVKLAGPYALACPCHRKAKAGVAGFT